MGGSRREKFYLQYCISFGARVKKKDADIELTKSIFKKRQFLLLNRINELKKEKEEVIKLSKINHNDVVRQEKYPDDIEKNK